MKNMEKETVFSDKQLKEMIVPLLIEQFLLMLVGMADTFIVSYAGEAAVSGVSLVNAFNTVFLFLFTALASGGAVIVSQYIGKKDNEKASDAVSQLLMISVIFSVIITILILIFNEKIIRFLFGKVEKEVMESCITYLRISAYSYPALAVYNAGAALYRSIGRTNVTMNISVISNIINIIGNLIGVFYFKAGTAGVAYPSLIARVFSAGVITYFCFQNKNQVRYYYRKIFQWNKALLNKILKIAVPNGIESGIFQLLKVALSSIAALFGTYQIAANGIAQSIWSVAALITSAMGPVFITVIGQSMGAGKISEAEMYFKKLIKITVIISVIWNILIFAATPFLMQWYAVSDEIKKLVILLVLIHNTVNALAFPFADSFGKGLRAAGDVNFTVGISLITTIGVRLIFSYLFGIIMKMGVIGIACAMCVDWITRGIIFWIRFKKGNWKKYSII